MDDDRRTCKSGSTMESNGYLQLAVSRQLAAGFQEKCGATICKDLKGIETGRVLCSCPECVRNAVLTLGEVLKLEEKV